MCLPQYVIELKTVSPTLQPHSNKQNLLDCLPTAPTGGADHYNSGFRGQVAKGRLSGSRGEKQGTQDTPLRDASIHAPPAPAGSLSKMPLLVTGRSRVYT